MLDRTLCVLSVFESCGAVLENGHFVYTSGRHGRAYVNKDALYPRPEVISDLCDRIAEHFAAYGVEVVLAPALGGIVLAQWTAFHLGKRTSRSVLALFAEKADTPTGFTLKRGYDKLVSGKKTLVVEDVLTTGGSVRNVVRLAVDLNAQVLAVAALCNRGAIRANDVGVPELFALAEVALESWDAKECPLCRQNVPLHRGLGKA